MTRLIANNGNPAAPVPNDGPLIEVGQWYWVNGSDEEWLGCVVEIGSNYAEFNGPSDGHSDHVARVHLDEVDKTCRQEADPEAVIGGKIAQYQGIVQAKLAKIREITARLGLTPSQKIGQAQPVASRALSVLSGTDNVKAYKRQLIRAKDTTLPDLFKEVEAAHSGMAAWMGAPALPIKAMSQGLKGCVEKIEDRVFNISLYAGLKEDVVEIAKGKPARADERIRLFQRRLYMDEECLLNYRHGGMEFKQIEEFDAWLAEPTNRDRVLPFPRCMVAFQVRREKKDRDWGGDIAQAFINIRLEDRDKLTFFYIRNGERLYRMDCEQDFDTLVFPSKDDLNLTEPMMAKEKCGEIRLLPQRSYDDIKRTHRRENAKLRAWKKAHPKKHWMDNPHREHTWCDCNDWAPFDKSNLYFDEIQKSIEKRVQYYNRIALILQGLLDRSMVFHPHAPHRLWDPEGFERAVELVYDGANVLSHGAPPDFRAYQERCNRALKAGSVTIGQDAFWSEREAEKENARLDRGWRRVNYRHTRFKPYGNPGPGYLGRVAAWSKRLRRATFKWNRKRQKSNWKHEYGDPIPTSITVPADRLFNVDAYKPGDYKQFFEDPRTRAAYLKWAPMLLAAEEYHAGNLEV